MTDSPTQVGFGIDKETLLSILQRAASQERTVIEFRTTDDGDDRELETAVEITEHVAELEAQYDVGL
jgi:hypothetical protein